MKPEENIRFEAYLNGELSKEEAEAFEIKLRQDDRFRSDFELYRDLSRVVGHHFSEARKDFISTLEEAETNYSHASDRFSSKKRKLFFKPWHYAAAASVLILIGVFLFGNWGNPVYTDYAKHSPISLTLRGQADERAQKAEEAYNQKDYKNALIYLNQLLSASPQKVNLQYYKAVSLVETDQFEKADALLMKLAQGQSVYASKALWMAALSKLKQKDYQATRELLKSMPPQAPEYEKAQQLLGDL